MKKDKFIKIIVLIVIAFATLVTLNALAQTEEELIIETPYIAEGEVEELVQLKEAGDIETFQQKLEDFVVSVFPSLRPPIITNVRVEDITFNSAAILWETNIKSNSLVALAEDKDYDPKKENPYTFETGDAEKRVKKHRVMVTNLKPGTLYHFQAKSASLIGVVGKSKDFTFVTKAEKPEITILKIKETEVTLRWLTERETSSYIELKDLKTGRIKRTGEEVLSKVHSLILTNLTPNTPYEVKGFGYDEKGILIETNTKRFVTLVDVKPPEITGIKLENAIVPGRVDRLQTIIFWKTDEPATSQVYYEEGIGVSPTLSQKSPLSEGLTTDHVIILTTFKPATVYRFQVVSVDASGNESRSPIRTILTPQRGESILDIIIRNLEQTFGWMKMLRRR